MKKPSRPLLATLAGNLRFYRRQKGLSQEKLAGLCGCDRSCISDAELSKRNITLLRLGNLATALGVSVLDLLAKKEHPENIKSPDY